MRHHAVTIALSMEAVWNSIFD